MVQNDIAHINYHKGVYHISLNDFVTCAGAELTTEEAICMLALFSSFMRDKGVKKTECGLTE